MFPPWFSRCSFWKLKCRSIFETDESCSIKINQQSMRSTNLTNTTCFLTNATCFYIQETPFQETSSLQSTCARKRRIDNKDAKTRIIASISVFGSHSLLVGWCFRPVNDKGKSANNLSNRRGQDCEWWCGGFAQLFHLRFGGTNENRRTAAPETGSLSARRIVQLRQGQQ